jgi:hypothetical protein
MRALWMFIFCFTSFVASAHASIRIPDQLNHDERQEALRILGLGASSKILSDPYPLGGYSGFEVGMSAETLPADNLNRLGDSNVTNSTSGFSYQSLSVGKGIYNDVDIFLEFTPWGESNGITEYGGLVRWSFYEAKYLPMEYSLVVHTNALNIHDAMISSSMGAELLTAVNFHNYSVYFGLGDVDASGRFEPAYTDSKKEEAEEVNELHTFIGATARLDEAFVAFEIDRYTISVYSAKVGLRF